MPSPTQAGAGAIPGGRSRHSTPVDDYVGLPATEAIEAARAAGLRPAPERVEASEPGQDGFVIAQEPVAGSPAPPDGLLTLFVAEAAHEAEAADPDSAPESSSEDALDLGAEATPPAEWELDDLDAGPVDEPIFGAPEAPDEPAPQEPRTQAVTIPRSTRRGRWLVGSTIGLAAVFAVTVAAALQGHSVAPSGSRTPRATAPARAPEPSPIPSGRTRTSRARRAGLRAKHRPRRRLTHARKRVRVTPKPSGALATTPRPRRPFMPPPLAHPDPERDEFF